MYYRLYLENMAKVKDLYDFIDRAARSHKYPDATAWNLKNAIKKFEPILTEEESGSIQRFKENLDPLIQKLFSRDKNISASSLTTYKSRAAKAIADFEKYGSDATKMSNWTVKTVIRARREKKTSEHNLALPQTAAEDSLSSLGMARFDLPLRADKKIVLIVPTDITSQEREIIKGLLDSLNPEE